MSSKCLVRGSINVDEFFSVPAIVRPGQTISSQGLDRKPGGKGANQAAAVARACEGRNAVDLVGAVGSDGLWVKDLLEATGVDVAGVSVVEEPTGRAIIQLSEDGENSIILLQGANYATLPPPTQKTTSYTHVLLQNEIPWSSTIAELIATPKRTSIYNPSPMPSPTQLRDFPWSKLDWLIVNEGEAMDLLRAFDVPVPNAEDIRGIVTALTEKLPTTNVVCTLGAQGVVALLAESQSWIALPATKLQGTVRDTTGAGDCFAGYLTAGLMEHGDGVTTEVIEAILKKSVQAAGMCVERRGAMEAIPGRAEVEARIASTP